MRSLTDAGSAVSALLPRPSRSSTLRMPSCIAAILAWNGAATADDVGFEMANIGNPNNPADPATGLGRVEHTFAISKRSVTIAECVTFLNAVAKKHRHGLYNPLMASDPMIAGIRRDGPGGNDVYSAIEPSGAASPPRRQREEGPSPT